MLKTKDKRLICLIILSVSIVSLITAAVSGLVSQVVSLTIAVDDNYKELIMANSFTLGHVVIFLAVIGIFFFNRKKVHLANLIMLIVNVLLFVVFSVVMCCCEIEVYPDEEYLVYLSLSLTMIISFAFMTVSKWLLTRYSREELEPTNRSAE